MAIASSTGAQLQRAEIYSRDSRGKKHKAARHHMDVACTECGTPRRACTGPGTKGVCCDDCWHPDIVPVKETRSWAPRPVEGPVGSAEFNPGAGVTMRETMEERTAREGRYQRFLAELTTEERTVLELQGKLQQCVEVRATIAAGDLVDYQRDGYTLIPNTARMMERPGMDPIEVVDVYGHEHVATERMHVSGDGVIGEIDREGRNKTVPRMTYAEIAARIGKSISRVNKIVSGVNRKLFALRF